MKTFAVDVKVEELEETKTYLIETTTEEDAKHIITRHLEDPGYYEMFKDFIPGILWERGFTFDITNIKEQKPTLIVRLKKWWKELTSKTTK